MAKRRGHNEGSFYQINDGSRRGAITIRDHAGRAHQRLVRGRTKREAQQKITELRERLHLGPPADARRISVGEWLDDWLRTVAAPGVKATTLANYRTVVHSHLIPALGAYQLADLEPLHIQRFYARLVDQGNASKTVAGIHSVLSSSLSAARRLRLIAMNPAVDVTLPRAVRRRPVTLTDEQALHLIESAEAAGDPFAPLWTVAAYTGMCKGECLGLRWRDIDLDGGVLHVRQQLNRVDRIKILTDPKGRGERTLPLAPDVVHARRGGDGAGAAAHIVTVLLPLLLPMALS